jgi:hypothetical protein
LPYLTQYLPLSRALEYDIGLLSVLPFTCVHSIDVGNEPQRFVVLALFQTPTHPHIVIHTIIDLDNYESAIHVEICQYTLKLFLQYHQLSNVRAWNSHP